MQINYPVLIATRFGNPAGVADWLDTALVGLVVGACGLLALSMVVRSWKQAGGSSCGSGRCGCSAKGLLKRKENVKISRRREL
jgi:hypothetical protein